MLCAKYHVLNVVITNSITKVQKSLKSEISNMSFLFVSNPYPRGDQRKVKASRT